MSDIEPSTPFVDRLNALSRLLVDLDRLYDRAAGIADDDAAKGEISSARRDRLQLLQLVRSELTRRGAAQEEHGTIAGAVQAAVLTVRSLVDTDDHAALSEVQRGEGFLLAELNDTLKIEALSDDEKAFLEDLTSSANAVHSRITALKLSR